jgi:hypothetical protein
MYLVAGLAALEGLPGRLDRHQTALALPQARYHLEHRAPVEVAALLYRCLLASDEEEAI